MDANLTEQFVIREIKAEPELVRQILGTAAHLVATAYDPSCGVKIDSLSLDVRDGLEGLREELFETELLAAYVNDRGESHSGILQSTCKVLLMR